MTAAGNGVGGGSGANVATVTGKGVGGRRGAEVATVTGNGVGAAMGVATGNGAGAARGALTGNGAGAARGALTGNGVGGGMGVPNGAETGTRTGAGAVPTLLSIHNPALSMPTQSPTNRLEQSKYGSNSVSEIAVIVQLLQTSVATSGSLGFTTTLQIQVSTDRATLGLQ